jgi:flagellar biosynthetic protein FliP
MDGVHAHHGSGSRAVGLGYFLRHLGEMIVAMMVGMAAGGAVLALLFTTVLAPTISGMTQREVLNQFAVLVCLVVGAGMTATMVAWMRYRGMDRRSSSEMAVAMLLPLVPIFGLLWLRVIPGAGACGVYCVAMIPAMLVAMLYRYDLYAGHAGRMAHAG